MEFVIVLERAFKGLPATSVLISFPNQSLFWLLLWLLLRLLFVNCDLLLLL